jgi:hypothetical protein
MAIVRPLSLSFPVRWLLVLVGLQGETICWSVQCHLAAVGADLYILILLSATSTVSSTTAATFIVSTAAATTAATAATAAAVAATILGHVGEQVRVLLHDELELLLLGVEFSAQQLPLGQVRWGCLAQVQWGCLALWLHICGLP